MPLPNAPPNFDIDARPHIFRSPTEWASFWHGLAPWFKTHNYTLHIPGSKTLFGLSDGITVPANDTRHDQQHPPSYAFTDESAGPEYIYDSYPSGQSRKPEQNRSQTKSLVPVRVPPFIATSNTGRVYAAQDSLGRHVYLKIVNRDSEQFRVIELLRRQTETPGVLSIVDVLGYDDEYAFLVMPRWGDIPGPGHLLRTVGDAVEFVVGVLKGLDTLHSLRIVHRDIKINNLVMNHLPSLPVRTLRALQHLNIHTSFGDNTKSVPPHSGLPISHRTEFAIIDFDFAMIIPPSRNGKDRLPSTLAWMQEYSALDVVQGELVYDPFKYDVGVLGVMFCEMLQKFTPLIPTLAPLLDRMTTHELKKRFTAREARAFAEEYLLRGVESGSSEKHKHLYHELALASCPANANGSPSPCNGASPRNPSPRNSAATRTSPWTSYDRWANLPPSFFKEFPQWSEYVTPPVPRWKRWLRKACETAEGRRRVGILRKAFAAVGIGEGGGGGR